MIADYRGGVTCLYDTQLLGAFLHASECGDRSRPEALRGMPEVSGGILRWRPHWQRIRLAPPASTSPPSLSGSAGRTRIALAGNLALAELSRQSRSGKGPRLRPRHRQDGRLVPSTFPRCQKVGGPLRCPGMSRFEYEIGRSPIVRALAALLQGVSQSSSLRPGMCRKCRVLCVTTVRS